MYTIDFQGTFHSRKLLLDNPLPLTLSPPPTAAPPPSTADVSSFDNNVLLILAVTLCGLIFSFGINFMLRCALRCGNSLVSESGGTPAAQLAKRGIKEKALKTFPVVNYSAEMNERLPGLDTECVICLSEFEAGESLRMLPKCNHGFHVGCIDKWLKSNSSCPKCRRCLIEKSQKIVRTPTDSSRQPPPAIP